MDIKCIKTYPDKELRRVVKENEVISVADDRGGFLIEKGYAEKVKKGNQHGTID